MKAIVTQYGATYHCIACKLKLDLQSDLTLYHPLKIRLLGPDSKCEYAGKSFQLPTVNIEPIQPHA